MNTFDELCKKLTQDVANNIVQGRSWNEAEQLRFNYAVRHLLIGLWKNIIPIQTTILQCKRIRTFTQH